MDRTIEEAARAMMAAILYGIACVLLQAVLTSAGKGLADVVVVGLHMPFGLAMVLTALLMILPVFVIGMGERSRQGSQVMVNAVLICGAGFGLSFILSLVIGFGQSPAAGVTAFSCLMGVVFIVAFLASAMARGRGRAPGSGAQRPCCG